MNTLRQQRRRKYLSYAFDGMVFGLLMITFAWVLTDGMRRELHRQQEACRIDQARGYDTGDCEFKPAGK